MLKGVMLLSEFFTCFIEKLLSGQLFCHYGEEYLAHFSYICKTNKGEVKLLELIHASPEILKISDEIHKLWIELSQ